MQLLPDFPAKSDMKRAIESSPADAWAWIAASPARKRPTNLSSLVIFPVGKESTRVPGGKEGRDLITMIHNFTLAQAIRTCTPRMGLWKSAEDTRGSCSVYNKAETVLTYLLTIQRDAEYSFYDCLNSS